MVYRTPPKLSEAMILLLLSLCLKLFLQGLEGPVRRDSKGFLGIGREILADGVVGIEILRGIEDHRISAGLGKLFNGLPHLGDDGLVKLLFLLGKFLLDGLLELLETVVDLAEFLLFVLLDGRSPGGRLLLILVILCLELLVHALERFVRLLLGRSHSGPRGICIGSQLLELGEVDMSDLDLC